MAAFRLRIDGYELADYVNVNQGGGLDLADPTYLEPQFGESALGAGEPLVSLRERNRQIAIPLHLDPRKTASFTDNTDGLHQLLQDLNRRLQAAAQLEWRDASATNSTFYDVVFARFDHTFDYRRQNATVLSGTLRVWVKPYGNTGTTRSLGSPISASGAAFVFTATGIEGDAPALIDAVINYAQTVAYATPGVWGISALSTAHLPFIGPASMAQGVYTVVGASGAAASQAMRVSTQYAQQFPRTTYGWHGRNRLIALVRSAHPSGHAFQAGVACAVLGPTAAVPPGTVAWGFVDLGVVSLASGINNSPRIDILSGPVGSAAASSFLEYGGLLVLPEETTVMLTGNQGIVGAGRDGLFRFDGVNRRTVDEGTSTNEQPRDVSKDVRGRIPALTGSQARILFFGIGAVNHNVPLTPGIAVREQFRYAR